MKNFVAWFAENHVAANLLMLFMLLAGAITALTMKMEVFPESTLDQISITTSYPGASPAEVEEAVIRRIEERVAGLAGLKKIESTAREGSGTVILEVMKGWDLENLLDGVKAEVDRITTFPEEAEKPVVREMIRQVFVIMLAVYGDAPEKTIKHLAEKVKDDITNLPGITLAQVSGVRTGEIHIEVSEKTLRQYGVTLGQVAEAVRRASLDLPAGSIKTAGSEILIRTKGRRYHARDYRDIPVITRGDGSVVTLGRIAELQDGFEDVDRFARFNGKPAALVQVYRVADQRALDVANTVKKYVEKIKDTMPAGVEIAITRDMSQVLKSRINLLLKNMGIGLVLVIIILGLFMNIRLAFWVTLGIPVSFAISLWLLPQFDVTLNMMSLFAYIMVLGIVVDDAIIVGENVFRKQEAGYPPLKAAVEGTLEVGRPVIFAVLTTVAAFYPLLLGSGGMGKVMSNIPFVVILVLMGSLVESLMILPSHLAGSKAAAKMSRRKGKGENPIDRGLKAFIRGPYFRFLRLCIRWRYATVALSISLLLLAVGIWQGGLVRFTFFPRVEGDTMICTVTMPAGVPVSRTVDVVTHLEEAAQKALGKLDRERPAGAPPLLESIQSIVGSAGGRGPGSGGASVGGHLAQVIVRLIDSELRQMSTFEIGNLWRKEAGPIPDAESVSFAAYLFRAGNPVEVHLSHDNNDLLLAAAEGLKNELGQYPGVFDIGDSFLAGKPEMQLKLRPVARPLGLTLEDLARQVRHAFYGAEALRFQRGEDEVKVLVRYPESERKSLGHVEEMRIRAPGGSGVPFSQVAEVKMDRGYASIERTQRLRVIKVTADVDEETANANEIRADLEKRVLPELQARFPDLRYTMEGEGREQKESLADVIRGFAIALFCIYALLAIPFRSFTQPLIVMFAIPFGLLGALLGHMVTGYNLTVVSLFGMVGLSGVVVNDSLVLVHATNRIRDNGATTFEAILKGTALRFRAIILTSLTTFGGLTPMLLEKSLQANFLIPMAISLGFGVLFATAITLILIPCGYVILDDIHGLISSIKGGVYLAPRPADPKSDQ
ncbi:MAG: efflux RND transporter permease subunit [Deltaproteobacteria bacterium]|nr:efflux RND transporter permease subunit [Deltaproteobacteria bacterium]